MASLNEVKAIAENMEYQSGRIMSQDDVAKLLSDHHLKKIEDVGFIQWIVLSLPPDEEKSFSFDCKSRERFNFQNKHSEDYHQICCREPHSCMH